MSLDENGGKFFWGVEDLRIQRFEDSKIQRFEDSKIQGFEDSKIRRFKDSRIQRFKDLKIEKFKDLRIQRFKDSRIQRFEDLRGSLVFGTVSRRWLDSAVGGGWGEGDEVEHFAHAGAEAGAVDGFDHGGVEVGGEVGLVEGEVFVAGGEDLAEGVEFVAVMFALVVVAEVVEAGSEAGMAELIGRDGDRLAVVAYEGEAPGGEVKADLTGGYEGEGLEGVVAESLHDGGFASADPSGQQDPFGEGKAEISRFRAGGEIMTELVDDGGVVVVEDERPAHKGCGRLEETAEHLFG